jgi:hypothetical protein
MNTSEKLQALNTFRAAEGKEPLTTWKNARHQPMLDAYEAAKGNDFSEATEEELRQQAGRPESYEDKVARIRATEYTDEQLAAIPNCYHGVEPDADGTGHCPHCGIHLSNGAWSYSDADKEQKKQFQHEHACLGCGEEYGPAIVRTKQADRHTGEGLKIEPNRVKQNGVTRPSAGGKCREIWDYLDEVYDGGKGPMPTAKMVKEAAEQCEWNPNNASIEFYQWRKFHGIKGRQ